jgi:hypothetical protein
MAEKFQFIDINASGAGMVAAAFDNQVAYCTASGASVTARICAALRDLIERGEGGAVLERVRDWPGAPLADALPLRLAGGLHALHLKGAEPALKAIYDDLPGLDDAAIVAAALHRHEADLLPWLDGPPQTNEAGRSANFIAAMLWLADKGLPPRFECLEIGSSAGINLMLDRYHYDLGGVQVGRGYLKAGETITVRLGDRRKGSPGIRLQTNAEDAFTFKVFVDPFATYEFCELPVSPSFRLVPGPSARWKAIVPSAVAVGEPFRLALTAEDAWGCPRAWRRPMAACRW